MPEAVLFVCDDTFRSVVFKLYCFFLWNDFKNL